MPLRAAASVAKHSLIYALIMLAGVLAGRAVDPQPGGTAALGPWAGLMLASVGLPLASLRAKTWWAYALASVAGFAALFFAALGLTQALSPGGLDALGPGGIMYLGPLMIFPAATAVFGLVRALAGKAGVSRGEGAKGHRDERT